MPISHSTTGNEGETYNIIMVRASNSDVLSDVDVLVDQRICEWFHCSFCLQVLDVQEALGVSHTIPIAIKGEAYKIEVDIKFPEQHMQVGAKATTQCYMTPHVCLVNSNGVLLICMISNMSKSAEHAKKCPLNMFGLSPAGNFPCHSVHLL